MVCLPCFIGLARDMILALTEPENEEVIAALALAVGNTGEQVPGPRGKPGKRNAPATSHDDGIFDEFDDIIETEELRDAFG